MSESDTAVRYDVNGLERHDVPKGGRSGFVVIEGRQVHYLEWGPTGAPPVLAMHGGGQTAYMFEELGNALRANRHVIAVDLPGHGDSTELDNPMDFSRQRLAATVPPLLAEFGVGPVSIVGASLGGIIALTVAAEHARSWSRAIVLIDVGHRLEEAGVRRIVEFMGAPRVLRIARGGVGRCRCVHARPSEPNPERLRRNLRQRPDGRWVWKHNLGAVSADRIDDVDWQYDIVDGLGEDAAKVTVPVMVLRGAKSDVLSSDGAEEIAQLLPDGRLVEVHNAGHLAAGDNPESTVSLITSFLDDVVPVNSQKGQ